MPSIGAFPLPSLATPPGLRERQGGKEGATTSGGQDRACPMSQIHGSIGSRARRSVHPVQPPAGHGIVHQVHCRLAPCIAYGGHAVQPHHHLPLGRLLLVAIGIVPSRCCTLFWGLTSHCPRSLRSPSPQELQLPRGDSALQPGPSVLPFRGIKGFRGKMSQAIRSLVWAPAPGNGRGTGPPSAPGPSSDPPLSSPALCCPVACCFPLSLSGSPIWVCQPRLPPPRQ